MESSILEKEQIIKYVSKTAKLEKCKDMAFYIRW